MNTLEAKTRSSAYSTFSKGMEMVFSANSLMKAAVVEQVRKHVRRAEQPGDAIGRSRNEVKTEHARLFTLWRHRAGPEKGGTSKME